ELARLKADFSAMVAHELDSPLSAIRKLNEMINARGGNSEVRGYATATMTGEIEALNALIDDVRAAGRDEFEVHPRPLPVGTLIEEAKVYAGLLPGGHPVTTAFLGGLDAREMVWADPERIAQVLRNLLINAAKYSPTGAPIELRASLGAEQVRIEVVDQGAGVSAEDVDLIFEKFGRGRDGEGREVAGKGLGLYISQRIMGGHGSRLTVRPGPHGGSVFVFDLDIAR
ncbi:MAG TPA: HAMP domain-containing sensor histidine kinase, partial [Rubrobacter sp.]|nr:HAMP domain-containing sensor histidine kinase [Rubrobacter sp.]